VCGGIGTIIIGMAGPAAASALLHINTAYYRVYAWQGRALIPASGLALPAAVFTSLSTRKGAYMFRLLKEIEWDNRSPETLL
jgi:hypothetical protein